MAVKLTTEQVPRFWEAIKYASVNSGRVRSEYVQSYCSRLLYELLSGTAQVFVRLDEKRNLAALAVTKVLVDDITGSKSLRIDSLFSFAKQDVETWIDDLVTLKKFASNKGCRYIIGWTNNPRVIELCSMTGFKERLRSYVLDTGGL